LSPKVLLPLLGYLRGLGVPPEARRMLPPATRAEALLDRWQQYLTTERGLGPATAP
jgi:hypothetical protein